MRAKVSKWGNSLAVRLPKAVAESAGLAVGQTVELLARNGRVELCPVTPARFTLEDLVAEMKRLGPEGEPPTVAWGADVGSEVIGDDLVPGKTASGEPGRLPRASRRR